MWLLICCSFARRACRRLRKLCSSSVYAFLIARSDAGSNARAAIGAAAGAGPGPGIMALFECSTPAGGGGCGGCRATGSTSASLRARYRCLPNSIIGPRQAVSCFSSCRRTAAGDMLPTMLAAVISTIRGSNWDSIPPSGESLALAAAFGRNTSRATRCIPPTTSRYRSSGERLADDDAHVNRESITAWHRWKRLSL